MLRKQYNLVNFLNIVEIFFYGYLQLIFIMEFKVLAVIEDNIFHCNLTITYIYHKLASLMWKLRNLFNLVPSFQENIMSINFFQ